MVRQVNKARPIILADDAIFSDSDDPEAVKADLRRLSLMDREIARRRTILRQRQNDLRQAGYMKVMDQHRPEIIVSDHAIVRYLERVKGINVEAIRNHIQKLYRESTVENKNEYVNDECVLLMSLDNIGKCMTIITHDQHQNDQRHLRELVNEDLTNDTK